MTPVRTTCPYCGVGCGGARHPRRPGRAVGRGATRTIPLTSGGSAPRGAALGETVGLEGRLLHPVIRGVRAVLGRGTGRRRRGAFASCCGARRRCGRLLPVGPAPHRGLLRRQQADEGGSSARLTSTTNSRLCMASSVAGHRRAFGADTVPGCYEDLDEADLLVLVGSNTAWCHPVLFRRMLENRAARGAPDRDDRSAPQPRRATRRTSISGSGPAAIRSCSAGSWFTCPTPAPSTSPTCRGTRPGSRKRWPAPAAWPRTFAPRRSRRGLAEVEVAAFFDLFRATERVVTCYSQGVNQSAQGTDKVGAIVNCHLATGRIGRPGMGPFSLTGQPNAMGGREVGGPRQHAGRPYGLQRARTGSGCAGSGRRRGWSRRRD